MTSEEFARRVVAMLDTLYRVAYTQLPQPADREDAVQETIRRAWEKRGRLREERYMQTWMIRILLNVCDTIRRRDRRTILTDMPPVIAAPVERDLAIMDALRRLEDKYRLPIQMYYMEGYDLTDVALMLRLPKGTVKSRLSRGRDHLREMLREEAFEQ